MSNVATVTGSDRCSVETETCSKTELQQLRTRLLEMIIRNEAMRQEKDQNPTDSTF